MHVEMLRHTIQMNHSVTDDFLDAVVSGPSAMDKFLLQRGPYVPPDEVLINKIGNLMHYVL
jgi:hypothetical protein